MVTRGVRQLTARVSHTNWGVLGQHEITEFLTEQATGVLALSEDRRAYGIPMPFAYDEESERAIMDLGFTEESKKRAFLETTDEVSEGAQGWYYDVATDIDVSSGDVELEWYVLDVDDVSGVALCE